MRYFGSKGSVVERIGQVVEHLEPGRTFCDPFGGVGVVGKHFKSRNYEVTSADVLRFATLFQISSLCRSRALAFQKAKLHYGASSTEEFLAALCRPKRGKSIGWFVEEYSAKRKFFTKSNAIAIDRCWTEILTLHKDGSTSEIEHAVLLASLIDSMDRVANTAGTYYAYLKEFTRKALKPFQLNLLAPVAGPKGSVHRSDALEVVGSGYWDVLYLDPPYNERDYGAYYHLPETIAAGQQVEPCGKSGRPLLFAPKSRFTRPSTTLSAIEDLVNTAQFGTLIFHYADDGLLSKRVVKDLLGSIGRVRSICTEALGYRTTAGSRGSQHRIYVVTHA